MNAGIGGLILKSTGEAIFTYSGPTQAINAEEA